MAERIKIFVAEDQPLSRFGLVNILNNPDENLTVIGDAENGDEALRKIEKLKPDVVLMDIGLPGKSGIQITKEIKSRHPEIRIIMFTVREEDEDIHSALSAGADAYCLKSSSDAQLIITIKAVHNGLSCLDPRVAPRILRGEGDAATLNKNAKRLETVRLSGREKEVLGLIIKGMKNREIADSLELSQETVKTHVRHIKQKLSVKHRTQVVVAAIKRGLTHL